MEHQTQLRLEAHASYSDVPRTEKMLEAQMSLAAFCCSTLPPPAKLTHREAGSFATSQSPSGPTWRPLLSDSSPSCRRKKPSNPQRCWKWQLERLPKWRWRIANQWVDQVGLVAAPVKPTSVRSGGRKRIDQAGSRGGARSRHLPSGLYPAALRRNAQGKEITSTAPGIEAELREDTADL